ncbi:serine/threonine protein kinase [Oceanisphaera avium]|uniref:Stress response kinase A n=1 Tax=Oceanisphaera avium TaxID=1903694 RepID=A0A1Y0D018_9GAMM|nr:serine/threonine protein kinase [Oceanisphaera avium]ART80456.1 stress response serine/threonine protein kinase YihE [Oceanisphaera avium]
MDYYALTPDVIIDAMMSIDLHVDSGLMALNSYENRVYRFKSEQEGAFVAKFYRPGRWSQAQIQEEHDFLFALAKGKVRVALPLVREQQSVFSFNGIWFAVWPAVAARQFETDNLDQLAALGEQLGRLHNVGEQFSLVARASQSVSDKLAVAREVLMTKAAIPAKLKDAFFTQLDALIARTCDLYVVNNTITLHGDCHASNILWQDGPYLLDFDDCAQGPAVQDMWLMLSGSRQEQLLQLDTLLDGYEQEREFDRRELALIEPLRAIRIINYMAWLTARWLDPAFPANFPWFNTPDYWQQQLGVLQEQLQQLNAPPLSLTSWG